MGSFSGPHLLYSGTKEVAENSQAHRKAGIQKGKETSISEKIRIGCESTRTRKR